MNTFDRFMYDSWFFDAKTGVLALKYQLDDQIFFTEKITFPIDQIHAEIIETDAFKAAIDGLWIMSGISYFKATLPPTIAFKNYALHPEQQSFFEKIFLHGLGEFFYVNDIDPKGKINFLIQRAENREQTINKKQSGDISQLRVEAQNLVPNKNVETLQGNKKNLDFLLTRGIKGVNKSLPTNAKILLPIGGGKDSLVSAKLLEKSGFDYTPWMVGSTQIQQDCCMKLGKTPFVIGRNICPNLIQLNKDGALNGHVPISAIWAFLSVVTALLTDHTHVALSNEASANSENLEFHGLKINHQYSKSLEFEQDFQRYVDRFVNQTSPLNEGELKGAETRRASGASLRPVHYFSLLRNLREIDIAQIFAEDCWDDFKDIFASCNRNFTITNKKDHVETLHATSLSYPKNVRANGHSPLQIEKNWCCACPKCAFVFLILAPFVNRDELIAVFGENLFTKPELKTTFDELLGISGHKPLECVGEINECREALHLAKLNWPEVQDWNVSTPNET